MEVVAIQPCFVQGGFRNTGDRFDYTGKLFKGQLPKSLVRADGKEIVKESVKVNDEGPTRKEIMAQLDLAGVEYKQAMNREELLSLLGDVVKKVSPGSSTFGRNIPTS